MPTLDSLLKSEIARLARKEVRAELDPLRKVFGQQRATLAALKRQVSQLERALRAASKGDRSRDPATAEPGVVRHRYSAKGLVSHRSKVGLSAEQYGKLVGVTGQSIYKWEAGKARPRAAQLPALAQIKRLGRRELLKRLG